MRKYWMFALLLIFAATASFGACHAVTPSGSGSKNGADWNDAYAGLPSALTRGDVYYMADGGYGSYNFATSNSGTSTITIKKAQSYDYGRSSDGCSNDISSGWSASTMGSSQATFSGGITANLGIEYIVINGNGQYTGPGCGIAPGSTYPASDCGFFFGPLTASGGAYIYTGSWDNGSVRNDYWTIEYIEGEGSRIYSPDCATSGSCTGEDDITFRDGTNYTVMNHMYLHDSGCDFFKIPVQTGVTVENSFIARNDSSANCHGQMSMVEVSAANADWHANVIMDIGNGSTAVWSFVTSAQASNWNVYNNVIGRPSTSSNSGTSNGIFACDNSGTKCSNMNFIGNTLINGASNYSGSWGILDQNGGGSWTWENNLCYNTSSSAIGFSTSSSTFTEGYNSWLNCGSPASGTNDVTVTSGAPNPFVSWTTYNFTLTGQNSDWNNGAVEASPFDVDANGNARPAGANWDRGAYQYVAAGSAPTAPAPPTNLTVTVQ